MGVITARNGHGCHPDAQFRDDSFYGWLLGQAEEESAERKPFSMSLSLSGGQLTCLSGYNFQGDRPARHDPRPGRAERRAAGVKNDELCHPRHSKSVVKLAEILNRGTPSRRKWRARRVGDEDLQGPDARTFEVLI